MEGWRRAVSAGQGTTRGRRKVRGKESAKNPGFEISGGPQNPKTKKSQRRRKSGSLRGDGEERSSEEKIPLEK